MKNFFKEQWVLLLALAVAVVLCTIIILWHLDYKQRCEDAGGVYAYGHNKVMVCHSTNALINIPPNPQR
jgi:hypothetical protein